MNREKILILNPVSGSGDHVEKVERLADQHGLETWRTEGEGDAVELAEEAAEEKAELVAACGGDGTVNEVVRGLYEVSYLDEVTLGVVPGGTGNNFAGNIGVHEVPQAFDVIENGDRRHMDVGHAVNSVGRPFVNSCVGGLTADASEESDSAMKANLGAMAYVISSLRSMNDYDSMRLHVEAENHEWSGDALIVLVGNGRRFPERGRTQANMEDGLLEVMIIEDKPKMNLAGEAVAQDLLGANTRNISRFEAPSLEVKALNREVSFSLDGEMVKSDSLEIETLPSRLEIAVGPLYQPNPDSSLVKRISDRVQRIF